MLWLADLSADLGNEAYSHNNNQDLCKAYLSNFIRT